MQVGGRRRLHPAAPRRTATAAPGGAIAPGETLIFVVDLVDARLIAAGPATPLG